MLLEEDAPKNLTLGGAGLHLPPWPGGRKQFVSCGAADCISLVK